jgi:cytochrome c biogenesis protein CcdA
MDFGAVTYLFGFLAGAASVLSPCVLPLLPILIASALSKHRLGTLALAAGLALSFSIVGTALASAGAVAGLDPDVFRHVAAVLMLLFGAAMLSSRLSSRVAMLGNGISQIGHNTLNKISGDGLASQGLVGLLLGLVWSPCVGPTLGAATTLAAQGRDLGHIALLMLVFGLGAGAPLVILGAVSRATLNRHRATLAGAGKWTKTVLGTLFIVLGVLTLTGYDRNIEAALLSLSPMWLTTLTTSL